jgi:hypothetical protein
MLDAKDAKDATKANSGSALASFASFAFLCVLCVNKQSLVRSADQPFDATASLRISNNNNDIASLS